MLGSTLRRIKSWILWSSNDIFILSLVFDGCTQSTSALVPCADSECVSGHCGRSSLWGTPARLPLTPTEVQQLQPLRSAGRDTSNSFVLSSHRYTMANSSAFLSQTSTCPVVGSNVGTRSFASFNVDAAVRVFKSNSIGGVIVDISVLVEDKLVVLL